MNPKTLNWIMGIGLGYTLFCIWNAAKIIVDKNETIARLQAQIPSNVTPIKKKRKAS